MTLKLRSEQRKGSAVKRRGGAGQEEGTAGAKAPKQDKA